MGAIALGIAAICFWPAGKEGKLEVRYAGTATPAPIGVLFIISNTSDQSFAILGDFVHPGSSRNREHAYAVGASGRTVPPHGQLTNVVRLIPREPWTFSTRYCEDRSSFFAFGLRVKLGYFADDRHWPWLRKWVAPQFRYRDAYGPAMQGYKPLAEAQ